MLVLLTFLARAQLHVQEAGEREGYMRHAQSPMAEAAVEEEEEGGGGGAVNAVNLTQ